MSKDPANYELTAVDRDERKVDAPARDEMDRASDRSGFGTGRNRLGR